MPTGYYKRKGANAPLRHGHGSASGSDPLKEQWHDASTVHRSDPDAHIRENSWDVNDVRWSPKNRDYWSAEHIDKAERDRLVREAQAAHDAQFNGSYSYRPPAPTSTYDDNDNDITIQTDETPLAPAPAPAPALDALTLDDITPFVEKIAEVEQRVDQHDDSISAVETLASSLTALEPRVTALENAATQRLEIIIRDTPTSEPRVIEGIHHFMFPTLVTLVSALQGEDRNLWIAGPAGSGKTTAAHKLADALNIPFEYQGSITNPYELLGFIDAGGTYHDTAFRRRYEHGGVWLGDEMDGSSAAALLALNGALANSIGAFPDGMVKRHPDFYALAAANTWGFGGDANYVGRNKLDDATLDRFITLSWPYDEAFEASLIGATPTRFTTPLRTHRVPGDTVTPDEWIAVVHGVRDSARTAGAKIIVSPRASIKGAQLLNANLSRALVVEAIFGRYRTHSAWPTVGAAAEAFSKRDLITPPPPEAPSLSTKQESALKVDLSGVRVFS